MNPNGMIFVKSQSKSIRNQNHPRNPKPICMDSTTLKMAKNKEMKTVQNESFLNETFEMLQI